MTTGAPLYLVTACSSPEEFVAAFRRYTDRTGLFVPCAVPLPAGKRGRIALTLRDGSVMLEGEAEIVSSYGKPSALFGRLGMTLRYVEPDEPSKTLLGELERARIALKPVAPTVAPRPATVPAEPRPVAPPPGGRIDAANALAETVTIGDVALLRDSVALPAVPGVGARAGSTTAPPPMKAAPKFVLPAIPAKSPTRPPPLSTPAPAAPPVAAPIAAPVAAPIAAPKPAPVAAPPPAPAPPAVAAPAPAPAAPPTSARPSTGKPITATQPAAVVPPPARGPAPPVLRAPPLFVAEPDERTDLTDLTDAPERSDAVPQIVADGLDADAAEAAANAAAADDDDDDERSWTAEIAVPQVPDDAVPELAPPETRKTSLGMSAVLVAPAPPAPRAPAPGTPVGAARPTPPQPTLAHDTEVMSAEPGGVVGPASVDAHAPTVQPGAVTVDIVAAAANLSGDWTMTPDADAPIPLVTPPLAAPAPTPPAPPGPMTGDWIIATDAEAEGGWSAPAKVARLATHSGIGPPRLEVSSSEPLSSEPKREPAREETGPKVQIDPTLIEALPDPARLAASASEPRLPTSPLVAPPPPVGVQPDPYAVAAGFDVLLPPPPMPAPPLGFVPGRTQTPPAGMPLAPAMPPTSFSPPGGMVPMGLPPPPDANVGAEPPSRVSPLPGAFTPQPGFAPPVVVPMYSVDSEPAPITASAAHYSVGDSTAVMPGRGRRIAIVVALVLVLVAGGVFLVMTTGGSKRGAEASSGSGSGALLARPADGSGSAAPAPPHTAIAPPPPPPAPVDARELAVTAPAPDATAPSPVTPPPAPPPDATTCTVHVISAPAGADVLVDTDVIGHTPGDLALPCGVEVKLAFRKAPLLGQYRVITPKVGSAITVRVVLVKPTFSLKVSSSPAGAAITINGKAAGVTPSNVKLNAFESATIVLAKPGFESYTEKVTPKANAETVHGTLKRKK